MDLPSLRREARYGMPAADHILYNRDYVLGYSYYFRQAKWALEIVDHNADAERADNFRPDYRLPESFRADLEDYHRSGYDRGHLAASANHRDNDLQNSETFLLSNMSPQHADLNRRIWRELEEEVRNLNRKDSVLETYVICGPIFYFDQPVKFIGQDTSNEVAIPVPNAYFKSVLTEDDKGKLHMWSFIFPNQRCDNPIKDYRVSTTKVEQYAGIQLWSQIEGAKITTEKKRTRAMW